MESILHEEVREEVPVKDNIQESHEESEQISYMEEGSQRLTEKASPRPYSCLEKQQGGQHGRS